MSIECSCLFSPIKGSQSVTNSKFMTNITVKQILSYYMPTVHLVREGCGIDLFQTARTAFLDARYTSIMYSLISLSMNGRYIAT